MSRALHTQNYSNRKLSKLQLAPFERVIEMVFIPQASLNNVHGIQSKRMFIPLSLRYKQNSGYRFKSEQLAIIQLKSNKQK